MSSASNLAEEIVSMARQRDATCELRYDHDDAVMIAARLIGDTCAHAPEAPTSVDPNLVERCKELLEWSATGLLNGGTGGLVRKLAAEWEPKVGDMQALHVAESKTRDEAMEALVRIAASLSPSTAMTDAPIIEVDEDDVDVVAVAYDIAEQGFGRPWDDFLPCNAHDTDQGDLLAYARAAVDGVRKRAASARSDAMTTDASLSAADFSELLTDIADLDTDETSQEVLREADRRVTVLTKALNDIVHGYGPNHGSNYCRRVALEALVPPRNEPDWKQDQAETSRLPRHERGTP